MHPLICLSMLQALLKVLCALHKGLSLRVMDTFQHKTLITVRKALLLGYCFACTVVLPAQVVQIVQKMEQLDEDLKKLTADRDHAIQKYRQQLVAGVRKLDVDGDAHNQVQELLADSHVVSSPCSCRQCEVITVWMLIGEAGRLGWVRARFRWNTSAAHAELRSRYARCSRTLLSICLF